MRNILIGIVVVCIVMEIILTFVVFHLGLFVVGFSTIAFVLFTIAALVYYLTTYNKSEKDRGGKG